MAVAAIVGKMLYCPKCKSTYQEGQQRFCTNDGGRLLPSPSSVKPGSAGHGVFTSLLGRKLFDETTDEKLASVPRFRKAGEGKPVAQNTPPDLNGKHLRPAAGAETPIQQPDAKPVVRLVKPSEVPSGTVEIGDRTVNPLGREALTDETPDALIGQTIKGRYLIQKKISSDKSGMVFLAEDKVVVDKKVVFRVLSAEKNNDFLNKVFSEERIAFSHINHPNIAGMLDSGELPEGKSFIVTEYVDGVPLTEKLQKLEQFNALRTARIVRQVAYALGEVHQNGVLHRGLRPDNIILTVSDAGIELVKVNDFVVASGMVSKNPEELVYQSPEQIEGKMPNYASDIYSLAVIAFQMLTGRLPFNQTAPAALIKSQKQGLTIKASNLRLDIPPTVDEVLAKALDYDAAERYPKARDFGDALFNAISPASTSIQIKDGLNEKAEETAGKSGAVLISSLKEEKPADSSQFDQIRVKPVAGVTTRKVDTPVSVEDASAKHYNDPAWEKRSPEPVNVGNMPKMVLFGILIVGLLTLLGASIYYFMNRGDQAITYNSAENPAQNDQQLESGVNATPEDPAAKTMRETEAPPPPRQIEQPADSTYFQNTKSGLKGPLLANYRGFSLYYPNSWAKNESTTNFIDLSKKEAGLPVEQVLVTWYDSKGTFEEDEVQFPKMVGKASKNFASQIPNYQMVHSGATRINNWRAWEMKFQGTFKSDKGDNAIWGRTLYVPAARPGVRSGLIITIIATSLSPDIKGVDDLGSKGESEAILRTFEPSQVD